MESFEQKNNIIYVYFNRLSFAAVLKIDRREARLKAGSWLGGHGVVGAGDESDLGHGSSNDEGEKWADLQTNRMNQGMLHGFVLKTRNLILTFSERGKTAEEKSQF